MRKYQWYRRLLGGYWVQYHAPGGDRRWYHDPELWSNRSNGVFYFRIDSSYVRGDSKYIIDFEYWRLLV